MCSIQTPKISLNDGTYQLQHEHQTQEGVHIVCSRSKATIATNFGHAARAATAEFLVDCSHDSVDSGLCRLLLLPIVTVRIATRPGKADLGKLGGDPAKTHETITAGLHGVSTANTAREFRSAPIQTLPAVRPQQYHA